MFYIMWETTQIKQCQKWLELFEVWLTNISLLYNFLISLFIFLDLYRPFQNWTASRKRSDAYRKGMGKRNAQLLLSIKVTLGIIFFIKQTSPCLSFHIRKNKISLLAQHALSLKHYTLSWNITLFTDPCEVPKIPFKYWRKGLDAE